MVQIRPNTSSGEPLTATPSPNDPTIHTTTSSTGNFGAEITEKMRQLENIQKQLRAYQVKIASVNPTDLDKAATQTSYTTHQIQSALTPHEQTVLQKLILQRKTVQAEIQSLQQKLLTPASSGVVLVSQASSSSATTALLGGVAPAGLTKLQLYQQILIKLNNFKNSKTVTMPGSDQQQQQQQQLQLTPDEFEQLKKLLELQNQLQTELALTQAQIATIQANLINANLISKPIANQTIQIVNSSSSSADKKAPEAPAAVVQQQLSQATNSGSKINDWSLADKYKVLELIKAELVKLKTSLSALSEGGAAEVGQQQQQQIKERYMMLVKKQSDIQVRGKESVLARVQSAWGLSESPVL